MGFFIPEKLYGVIGWPLGQTLSPLIHNIGLQALGMNAAYLAWPLQPEDLERFIKNLQIFKIFGVSVTIPHKMAVMPYLQNLSESAALAGAVNTLFWQGEELCGDNTDVTGFLAPLGAIHLESTSILLLGAGGAARAAAAGLRLSGARQVRITSPGNKRQYELAERFAFSAIKWEDRYKHAAQLVINATPLGMYGDFQNEAPYDFDQAPQVKGGVAYDLVYNPVDTVFLKQARAHGRTTISGLEMFFSQGNAQFHLWTGRSLPQKAKDALVEALNQGNK